MSQLQKAISRIQRREGPRFIGFGAASREQPRALLAGALASDAAGVTAAIEGGADFVVVHAGTAASAAAVIKAAAGKDRCLGALVDKLDDAGAQALKDAGADFAVSSLEGTAAAAMDSDRLGHVITAHAGMEDNTLRALGPLGLDAIYVELTGQLMSVADQLHLVRLASFSGNPLLVTVDAAAAVADLRVLRDSGAAGVVAPAGTSKAAMEALIASLKAVPAPKKGRREGGDIALVPAAPARRDEEHEHEEEDDD
ncbi:MAG: hypothetical protein HY875_01420 [Chloroflexi bacterium]|nr:hypothetical protein [Chloroflexota bacterium]